MKHVSFHSLPAALGLALAIVAPPSPSPGQETAGDKGRTVILTAQEVANLGIETVEVLEADFEDTFFCLGRIEAIPSRRGVVSSRIPGRILALDAFEGDRVVKGRHLVKVESRQPGDPPPSISLTAPLGGLVLENHAGIGEPVEPDTEILEIVDLSEVHAMARIPEDQAGKLRPGARARIRIAAVPDHEFSGELTRFGTRADPEGGTLDAVFVVADPTGRVRPGMRAEFSVLLGRRENVMAVPLEALQGDGINPFVFVKDFELPNAFVEAPLQVGAKNDRFVEVKTGLFPADEVVVRGAYPLAFAGSGSISLKEALDAAHGHEHNEDGSEIGADQGEASGHGAEHGSTESESAWNGRTLFFATLSGVLAVLLVLSLAMRRGQPQPENHA